MLENKGQCDVAFEFSPDDRVETRLGDVGIVALCCFERGGKFYTVNMKGGNTPYLPEDELVAAPGLPRGSPAPAYKGGMMRRLMVFLWIATAAAGWFLISQMWTALPGV